MSMREYVYLGPYIEFPAPTKVYESSRWGCTRSCQDRPAPSFWEGPRAVGNANAQPAFCAKCGHPMGKIQFQETKTVSFYDLLDHLDVDFALLTGEEEHKPGIIILGANRRGPRNFNAEGHQEITPYLIESEIAWFKAKYVRDLENLETHIGSRLTVKWGAHTYIS